MAAIPLQREIYYPESDGEPMGETEVHIREIMDLIHVLKARYKDAAEVYVGGDMLLYYVEGHPARRVCPDVFVTIGIPKLPMRRSYFTWREGRPPSMVIEVTSEGSRKEDLEKRATYAQIGVEEYFLYDPLEDYLRPSLQGYRLVSGQYQPIPPNFDGCLLSETTGLTFRREGKRLRLVDTASGKPLLRPDELGGALTELREELQEEKLARRKEAEARQAADAVANARAVLTVLRVRGITVPDEAREQILAEKDPARLERCLEKAAVAASVAEVIAETR